VPQDHFYRHLERTLDLSFVREFVEKTYAGGGRPSIDPIVFFKLQLVMFFEDIRSERLLMRHAAWVYLSDSSCKFTSIQAHIHSDFLMSFAGGFSTGCVIVRRSLGRTPSTGERNNLQSFFFFPWMM
jgi:hypothetical protein